MKNFIFLYNNNEINGIINAINETNQKVFSSCHGKYHADFVITKTESILQELNFDENTIELGKIAALLHDIGCIDGNKNHAQRSSEMCVKFLDKTELSPQDKNIIIQAVFDHSNGDNISSPVGAALLIADKIDISKDRNLPLFLDGRWNDWLEILCSTEKADIRTYDNEIIIKYTVTEKFSIDTFIREWKKGILIPIKAATYLKRVCKFEINDVEINLKSLF